MDLIREIIDPMESGKLLRQKERFLADKLDMFLPVGQNVRTKLINTSKFLNIQNSCNTYYFMFSCNYTLLSFSFKHILILFTVFIQRVFNLFFYSFTYSLVSELSYATYLISYLILTYFYVRMFAGVCM